MAPDDGRGDPAARARAGPARGPASRGGPARARLSLRRGLDRLIRGNWGGRPCSFRTRLPSDVVERVDRARQDRGAEVKRRPVGERSKSLLGLEQHRADRHAQPRARGRGCRRPRTRGTRRGAAQRDHRREARPRDAAPRERSRPPLPDRARSHEEALRNARRAGSRSMRFLARGRAIRGGGARLPPQRPPVPTRRESRRGDRASRARRGESGVQRRQPNRAARGETPPSRDQGARRIHAVCAGTSALHTDPFTSPRGASLAWCSVFRGRW